MGPNPLMLERRNGVARGMYNRLREDGRFAVRAILDVGQYCLDTILNHGGVLGVPNGVWIQRRGFGLAPGQ